MPFIRRIRKTRLLLTMLIPMFILAKAPARATGRKIAVIEETE